MAEKNAKPDVIIIGAGPAGLSAALWCAELGMSAAVFEKEPEAGGQLLRIFNPVKNYIGVNARNGRELRDIFLKTYPADAPALQLSTEIAAIEPATRSVLTLDGRQMSGRALIIAAGVRRRRLLVPGEALLVGKGLIESGSNERESARGKTVVIVGGGDAALENALILAELAAKIHILHRRPNVTARAEFTEAARRDPKIEFRPETIVSSIRGKTRVEGVKIQDLDTGITGELATDLVLVRIGVEPNTDLIKGKLELDPNGYILTSHLCETSEHGIYAIGDVSAPVSPTIASAVGAGATAAKAIFRSLHDAKGV